MLNVRASVGLQFKSSDNAPLTSEFAFSLPPAKSFSRTEVGLKIKAELGPQKDNSVIEHKVVKIVSCIKENGKKLYLFLFWPFISAHGKMSVVFRGDKVINSVRPTVHVFLQNSHDERRSEIRSGSSPRPERCFIPRFKSSAGGPRSSGKGHTTCAA